MPTWIHIILPCFRKSHETLAFLPKNVCSMFLKTCFLDTIRRHTAAQQMVDVFCVPYFIQTPEIQDDHEEVAALRNSLLDAQQDYENLQSQVASQKAHDAKVQLEKQKLEEDLKDTWQTLPVSCFNVLCCNNEI